MRYDIDIDGNGFYMIQANTKRGKKWLADNVQGADTPWGGVPCDDMGYTQDLADGAIMNGLSVRVNGRKYLGANRAA